MSGNQPTLGQAIDQILSALEHLDVGARRTALSAACMQLGIPLTDCMPASELASASAINSDRQEAPAVAPPNVAATSDVRQAESQIDIRAFKEQKRPSSARQMACVVGFYLQELAPTSERKETVNTQDLEKYFKQAKFKLPGKINQILADAKAAGYFDVISRGEYKLNAVGYNLVAHNLPDATE